MTVEDLIAKELGKAIMEKCIAETGRESTSTLLQNVFKRLDELKTSGDITEEVYSSIPGLADFAKGH